MANLLTDVAQQVLDTIGSDHLLGDIEDGTKEARTLLRFFKQCVMQLLRSAPWNWARREAPLLLLADASGNTPNVGNLVIGNQFIYEYALPTDSVKIRYVPRHRAFNPPVPNNNITPPNPNVPIVTGIGQPPYGPRRIQPARFMISNDSNYPPPQANSWETQGVSPTGRVVILTDVQNAKAVYTYLCLYPSVWDSLFRAGLIAYMAAEVAMPILKDKTFAMKIRAEQIAIAKDKILQARAASANESSISTSDIRVDWIDTRMTGGRWAGGGFNSDGGGPGNLWGDFDDCCGAGVVSGAAF